MYISLYQYISVSLSKSVSIGIYQYSVSVSQYQYLSVSISICQSVSVSQYLSVSISICQSVSVSISQCQYQSVSASISISVSISTGIYQSVSVSISISDPWQLTKSFCSPPPQYPPGCGGPCQADRFRFEQGVDIWGEEDVLVLWDGGVHGARGRQQERSRHSRRLVVVRCTNGTYGEGGTCITGSTQHWDLLSLHNHSATGVNTIS